MSASLALRASTELLSQLLGARILDLFLSAARAAGAAALIVTHSERAAAVADRALVLTAEGLAPRHAG